ncbi:MAG: hypothetical protein RIQ56_530 [Candidatus Parcubacteria bacterium]|jgi:sugar-specific transcriptional regulator TrmB
MIEEILAENGFSQKEAQVYIATLALGEAPLAKIAEKAHLERTTVYSIVSAMKEKGIVSLIKRRGIQYVSALPPRVLIDRFKHSVHRAELVLPQLLNLAYSSPLKPRIRLYEGMNGLKEILREFSYSKEQPMVFTDYEQMPAELDRYIRREVVPQRRKLGVVAHLIAPRNATNIRIQSEDSSRHAEHRLIDFPRAKNPIEILLFEKSMIGFLSFTQQEVFGLLIDSAAIYQTLRNLFELVWDIAGTEKSGER